MNYQPSIPQLSKPKRWYRKSPSLDKKNDIWAVDRPVYIKPEISLEDLDNFEQALLEYGTKNHSWLRKLFRYPPQNYQNLIKGNLIEGHPYYKVLREVERFDKQPVVIRILTGWFRGITQKRNLLCYYAATRLLSKEPLKTNASYWYSVLDKHSSKLSGTLPTLIQRLCSFFSVAVIPQTIQIHNSIPTVTVQQRGNEYIQQINGFYESAATELEKMRQQYHLTAEEWQQQVRRIKLECDNHIRRISEKAKTLFQDASVSNDAAMKKTLSDLQQLITDVCAKGEELCEWKIDIPQRRTQKREAYSAKLLPLLSKTDWPQKNSLEERLILYREELEQVLFLLKKLFVNCSTHSEWLAVKQQIYPLLLRWYTRFLLSLDLRELNNKHDFEFIFYYLVKRGYHYHHNAEAIIRKYCPTLKCLEQDLWFDLEIAEQVRYSDSTLSQEMDKSIKQESKTFSSQVHAIENFICSFASNRLTIQSLINSKNTSELRIPFYTSFATWGVVIEEFYNLLQSCNSVEFYEWCKDQVMPLVSDYLQTLLKRIYEIIHDLHGSSEKIKQVIYETDIKHFKELFQPKNKLWSSLYALETLHYKDQRNDFRNWPLQFNMLMDVIEEIYKVNTATNHPASVFLRLNSNFKADENFIFGNIQMKFNEIFAAPTLQSLCIELTHFLMAFAMIKYQGLLLSADGQAIDNVKKILEDFRKKSRALYHPDSLSRRVECPVEASVATEVFKDMNIIYEHVNNTLFNRQENAQPVRERIDLVKKLILILSPYINISFKLLDSSLVVNAQALQLKNTCEIFIRKATVTIDESQSLQEMSQENVERLKSTVSELIAQLIIEKKSLNNCQNLLECVNDQSNRLLKCNQEFQPLLKKLEQTVEKSNLAEMEKLNLGSDESINRLTLEGMKDKLKSEHLNSITDKLTELNNSATILYSHSQTLLGEIEKYHKALEQIRLHLNRLQLQLASPKSAENNQAASSTFQSAVGVHLPVSEETGIKSTMRH